MSQCRLAANFPEVRLMYRIREADGHDEDIAETLTDLHRLTFFGGAPIPPFDQGHWWLASHENILDRLCRSGSIDAGFQCRILLSGRCIEEAPWPRAAVAADAGA